MSTATPTPSTGPSSSETPYVVSLDSNVSIASLLTTGDQVGVKSDGVTPWKMVGKPDGLGAFDNGNGTFTVLMNHELREHLGVVREHGSIGAFVSKLTIDKGSLKVLKAEDLIQKVYLYSTATDSYALGKTTFDRLCSADLAPESAFFNSATGLGYNGGRLYLNGEEDNPAGRAFAHVVSGSEAGTSYELPWQGKFAHENAVANPHMGDKTLVAGLDDSPGGEVYFYVGDKKATGNAVEKAGLTGGTLYGVKVTELNNTTDKNNETNGTTLGSDRSSTFSLVNMGDVTETSGAALETASGAAGVTSFLRPEDGAWDTQDSDRFYFTTTNALNSPSRLWALDFDDRNNPAAGGTVKLLLDGTEGQQMLDNLTVTKSGKVLLQEDPGNSSRLAKIWEYDPATDTLKALAEADPARFQSGGAKFLTEDEESSGIIDVTDILGSADQNAFLFTQMTGHEPGDAEVVTSGQLMLMRSGSSGTAKPEPGTGTDNPVVAVDNQYDVSPDGKLWFNSRYLTWNDKGLDGGLHVTGISAATAYGVSMSMADDGTIVYRAPAGWQGTDSLTYTVQDVDGSTDTAKVFFKIGHGDDPLPSTGGTTDPDPDPNTGTDNPVIAVDNQYDVSPDGKLWFNARYLTWNDKGEDGGLHVTGISETTAYGVSVSMASDGTIVYRAPSGWQGTDSLTYTVQDVDGSTDTATVFLKVGHGNDPLPETGGGTTEPEPEPEPEPGTGTGNPVIAVDNEYALDAGATLWFNTRYLTWNDKGLDGGLKVTELDGVSAAGVQVRWDSDGTAVYKAPSGWQGTDSLNYTVQDVDGSSDTATVYLKVGHGTDPLPSTGGGTAEPEPGTGTGTGNPVVAVDNHYKTDVDQTLWFNSRYLTWNDKGEDGGLNVTAVDSVSKAGVKVSWGPEGSEADGTTVYKPLSGWEGTDSFNYTVEDVDGSSDTATVFVQVGSGDMLLV